MKQKGEKQVPSHCTSSFQDTKKENIRSCAIPIRFLIPGSKLSKLQIGHNTSTGPQK